jgi:hypothetical protein
MAKQNKYAKSSQLRFIVDKLHVGTSDEDVKQEILRRIRPGSMPPRTVAAIVKGALQIHHENQGTYGWVMGGGHGYTGRKNPLTQGRSPSGKYIGLYVRGARVASFPLTKENLAEVKKNFNVGLIQEDITGSLHFNVFGINKQRNPRGAPIIRTGLTKGMRRRYRKGFKRTARRLRQEVLVEAKRDYKKWKASGMKGHSPYQEGVYKGRNPGAGALAYLDSFGGLVPVTVTRVIEPGHGSRATQGKIEFRVNANKGGYRKGEIATSSAANVVPRSNVRQRKWGARIRVDYEWKNNPHRPRKLSPYAKYYVKRGHYLHHGRPVLRGAAKAREKRYRRMRSRKREWRREDVSFKRRHKLYRQAANPRRSRRDVLLDRAKAAILRMPRDDWYAVCQFIQHATGRDTARAIAMRRRRR